MVDSVTGNMNNPLATKAAPATSTTASASTSTALDKNAFLKLLVAQMSNQDPLNPTGGTEYVTQLAQFSMVEQSVAQSAKLDTISTQMGGISSNEATNLVGKTVNIRGKGTAWDGKNATGASATLAAPAAKVTVDIQDGTGKTIRTLQMGAQAGGTLAINWDGKDASGQPAQPGQYTLAITATDANGLPVKASQDVTGKVTSVSFDKGYPELQLDSGASAPISDLVSVGGIR